MTTFLKALFSTPTSVMKSPSFNDFSLHVGEDTESHLAHNYDDMDSESDLQQKVDHRPARDNVWQSTFNPNMNRNMRGSRAEYDTVDDRAKAPSVWDHFTRADTIKRVSFMHLDKDRDGFINAADLLAELGPSANVDEVVRKADKNGDGKIDFSEFCELLKQEH